MSGPRIGATPMSSAQRQARRRARLRQQRPASPAAPTQRLAPRPTRWAAAVATLIRLQGEYRARLDNLPQISKSRRRPTSYRHRRTRLRGIGGSRSTTWLRLRLIGLLTGKAPYKPAPAQAGLASLTSVLRPGTLLDSAAFASTSSNSPSRESTSPASSARP
jgi:hypothetical protein